MNLLRTNTLAKRFLLPVTQFSRTAAYWNKDWKPGPYPTTPEERAAAAKKYGLLPEEYEPLPDDGSGNGDYPKLPDISFETKDPYYPWDCPEHRRNFGEPMHHLSNVYSGDRYDCNIDSKERFSRSTQLGLFLGTVGGILLVGMFFEDKKIFVPMLARHDPKEGVHYNYK